MYSRFKSHSIFFLGMPAWPPAPFCHIWDGTNIQKLFHKMWGGSNAQLCICLAHSKSITGRVQLCSHVFSNPNSYSAIEHSERNMPSAGRRIISHLPSFWCLKPEAVYFWISQKLLVLIEGAWALASKRPIWILSPSHTTSSCVSFNKFLHLSLPQLSHL